MFEIPFRIFETAHSCSATPILFSTELVKHIITNMFTIKPELIKTCAYINECVCKSLYTGGMLEYIMQTNEYREKIASIFTLAAIIIAFIISYLIVKKFHDETQHVSLLVIKSLLVFPEIYLLVLLLTKYIYHITNKYPA